MAYYKIYIVFEKADGKGGFYRTGQFTYVMSSDIVSAIQEALKDPKYNVNGQPVVKSAVQES
jgi:hypothetical protein